MTEPRTAYLVSHTHWDREWYLTFSRFRSMLAGVVGGVLDALETDEHFEHFCLDGQSVVVEDYLDVRPEDEGRMRALVERGALSLGPFYVLPDEFLVSAEAHVRNLVHGRRAAARLGPVQAVGYMPDSFGHIAQMPQLLRGAGLDSFVYTRGNGDEIDELGWEYLWQAPDGSEVLAINQCGGYCNAAGLGFDEIWHAHTPRDVSLDRAVQQVRELFAKMAPHANGSHWLLNNGCDHFPVQRDFARVLGALREAFPDTVFRHTGLREFIDAVRAEGAATKRFSGELRGGRLHHILSGVWSARMGLKQKNDTAQTLLEKTMEPLAAYAHFCHGVPYPAGEIRAAWTLLLQNHPHDSICGCSIDEVHVEMGPRFSGVIESAEQCAVSRLQALAPTFGRQAEADRDTVLCLFNPLPEERTVVMERLVVLQPLGYDLDNLRLVDERGEPVPFEVVKTEFVERYWGVDYRLAPWGRAPASRPRPAPPDTGDCFLTLRFAPRLPACGHALLRLTDGGGDVVAAAGVSVAGHRIENEFLAVDVHPDGTLDLRDKLTGETWNGLNLLESTEDIGDEYDYSPAASSQTRTTGDVDGSVEILEAGGLSGRLEARFEWPLPARVVSNRSRRDEAEVRCPVAVRVRLRAGEMFVDIETRFDNRAEDHRVRAVFPHGVAATELVSDGHFYLNARPFDEPAGEHWVQPPTGTFPQQDYSLVQDGAARGLAIFNRGLPEIAADAEAIRLTLLRCVGWLSRDDFPTRRYSNAGPTVATPDAQCTGAYRFRYAIAPFAGDHAMARIDELSQHWRSPIPCVQGVEQGSVPGRGLLSLDSRHVRATAIKRHEERDTLVVRLFNRTDRSVSTRLGVGFALAGVWRTDLLEDRGAPLARDGNAVTLELGPHEIATIELAPRGTA